MASEEHKKQLDELDAEIEAMEAASGAGEQQVQPQQVEEGEEQFGQEAAEVVVNEHEQTPTVEASEAAYQQPEQGTTQGPKRRSWKTDFLTLENRYTKLRQASDQFKFNAKNQIASLQEGTLALQEDNRKLKDKLIEISKESPTNSVSSAFTEEDIDILGEGTINSFQTAVNTAVSQAVDPLNSELLRMKKMEAARVRAQADGNRSDARGLFRERLGQLVPDYMQVNSNPEFITWLRQQDPYGGDTRMAFFKQAETTGDVGRVAQYFVEFKQTVQAPQNMLEEHVSPMGGGGGGQVNTQQPPDNNAAPNFTRESINRFYDDVIAGKFKGQEALADKVETQIGDALSRPGGVVA